MKIIDFLREIFIPGNTYNVTFRTGASHDLALRLTDYATETVQNYISGLVSSCDFQTITKGSSKRKDDYYLWNYAPNANQSGVEFKAKLVKQLLKNGECLIVQFNDALYIAESYETKSDLMHPARFSQVTVKQADGNDFVFRHTFNDTDSIHIKLADSDLKIILEGINGLYQELLKLAAGKYKRADGRKGVLRVNKTASGTDEEKRKQQEKFEKGFKAYYESENAFVMLPNGFDYSEQGGIGSSGNSTGEISNIKELTKEALSRAAQIYKIPPALVIGETADTSECFNQMLTVCIKPLISLIENSLTRGFYGKAVLNGSELKINTTKIQHMNPFKSAEQSDKLLASGLYSINELRDLMGSLKIDEDWADQHWITKNYSKIEQIDSANNANNANNANDGQQGEQE